MEWRRDLTFQDIYLFLGNILPDPVVMVKVNGKVVQRTERTGYSIPDNGEIEVLNILRGG